MNGIDYLVAPEEPQDPHKHWPSGVIADSPNSWFALQ